jgi:hypothetical protein
MKKYFYLFFLIFLCHPILTSEELTNPRTWGKYENIVNSKHQEYVMIVGGGHKYYKYIKYPENFYLLDNNRTFDVFPDLELDITEPVSDKLSHLNNKFNVVVFEYVASDILKYQAFLNAYNFLKKDGIFLFDSPANEPIEVQEPTNKSKYTEYETEHGKIWTLFHESNLETYISIENKELRKKAIELITNYLAHILNKVGFKEIKVIKNINKDKNSLYSKYIKSPNKEQLPIFMLSAKKD